MWQNFKSMPFFLKVIFIHGFIFFIGSFVSLLPILGLYGIEDKKVSYQEWWASGTGIKFFIVSLIIGIGAICLLKKIKHARTIYLIAFTIAFLAMFVFELNEPNSAGIFISGLIFFALIYWYLFHAKSVVQYYSNDL